MIILAIDTSAIASAALIRCHESFRDAAVLASFATEDTRSHAEVLAPGIRALLAEQELTGRDIARIVVGVGPGPFTGLRSGIVTGRALAFAWGVPLDGMMSLDALAWDVTAVGAGGSEFLVAIDARRKELYWARYANDGTVLDGPHVTAPGRVPGLPVYGAGAALYPSQLEDAGASVAPGFDSAQPTAASLGLSAASRLAAGTPLRDTTPLYLRESDAQVPGPRKRAL
ncbi:tRNA (adenosine(37)-N6)-threonylcarbamoyltransferase complex dimerization subunit type 1 TsaB [Sinomonas notoginsengisoli]|uniref:tRNA (adenosine(37)-N6)-threonylcarbamoyltransferase complex dimerization subunit type 1 TsaB n=1 Tax=Sinomonas notoginsengisoli TaxID=1457311 RepID=UPI001F355A2B|nr:tRNA (adenosine(37)-N6)-threonylcarbamoyltransferase complex dimerization subunit type 1 TsaB [Sinomonas notoginsengisoli]